MAVVKYGAGKLKDEITVEADKKTGTTKVASKPLPKKEKSDGE